MSSSSSGLTRRRGTPSSATLTSNSVADLTTTNEATNSATSPTSPPSSRCHRGLSPGRSQSTHSTLGGGGGARAKSAQSVLPDGTRVAWDCEEVLVGDDCDIVPTDDRVRVPRLTLMEQVLLLGLKDQQGYLSFWNDSLSYVLRGTILMELALRGRIAMVPRPDRRRFALAERPIQVVDARPTGETLLDEALRLIRHTQEGTFAASLSPAPVTGSDYTSSTKGTVSQSQSSSTSDLTSSVTSWLGLGAFASTSPGTTEPNGNPRGEWWGVGTWMDLLSGETWNLKRVSYQLRQVRERLAKGLVDKGVLRTERRSFVIFDMATHPIADPTAKDQVLRRVLNIIRTPLKSTAWPPDSSLRDVALVTSAHAGNVLENVLVCMPSLGEREAAWARADEILMAFSRWPADHGPLMSPPQQQQQQQFPVVQHASVGLDSLTHFSATTGDSRRGGGDEPSNVRIPSSKVMGLDHLEVVAAVLSVFARMDSLI